MADCAVAPPRAELVRRCEAEVAWARVRDAAVERRRDELLPMVAAAKDKTAVMSTAAGAVHLLQS